MDNQKRESLISLNPTTAYLTGFIIGDGNLAGWSKSKKDPSPDYRIAIDISDTTHLLRLEKLIKSIITTKTSPKKSTNRGNRIPRLYLFVRTYSLEIKSCSLS